MPNLWLELQVPNKGPRSTKLRLSRKDARRIKTDDAFVFDVTDQINRNVVSQVKMPIRKAINWLYAQFWRWIVIPQQDIKRDGTAVLNDWIVWQTVTKSVQQRVIIISEREIAHLLRWFSSDTIRLTSQLNLDKLVTV